MGGAPPFRVWRSASRDFSSPVLLKDCCQDFYYVDAGSLGDGIGYFYHVESALV